MPEAGHRGAGGRIAWLLTGSTRVVVLFLAYLCALIPLYTLPFTIMFAVLLALFPRTRRHAVGVLVLGVLSTGILVLSTRH